MKARLERALLCVAVVVAALGASSAQAQMPGMPDMPHKDMRWSNTLFVLFEQLEYAPASDERAVNVDARAWYGGASRRLYVRGKSEFATTQSEGEAEGQLLYGKLVDPFWDAVVGLRVDEHWGDAHRRRGQLVVGFLGLAPYRFEVEPTIFVSQKGEVSARFEAAFQLLLTQRLIAEPEFEVNAALQAVPEFDVRRGLNDYELGMRVRYEFRREFAPYVGWSRSRRISGSSGTVIGGVPEAESRIVAGFRLWR